MIKKYMDKKVFKQLSELLDKIINELRKVMKEAKFSVKQETEIKTKIFKTIEYLNEAYEIRDENDEEFTLENVMNRSLDDLEELLVMINEEVQRQI